MRIEERNQKKKKKQTENKGIGNNVEYKMEKRAGRHLHARA